MPRFLLDTDSMRYALRGNPPAVGRRFGRVSMARFVFPLRPRRNSCTSTADAIPDEDHYTLRLKFLYNHPVRTSDEKAKVARSFCPADEFIETVNISSVSRLFTVFHPGVALLMNTGIDPSSMVRDYGKVHDVCEPGRQP
jgi:hypothetical protein